ncbi:GNAT family N-acetyltransferase [Vibrio cincinnatiensis]|uniref:GNAT family N-acetyltransferase n=1 Tax=Vibrio cincinnatiensis TaxID=675 RepID=UPI001EDD7553|nr:N-acetyltransferase [Vibrio cincinnatiensis]
MIEISLNDSFCLRSITVSDLENLRQWKNKHRNSFFYKEIITVEQQNKWFDSYLKDDKDYMFTVVDNEKAIGCMGFREKGDFIDVYNIMRGEKSQEKNFSMSDAFRLMLNYINYECQKKITCVVLNDNPAFNWYLKNDFLVLKEIEDYSLLEYQPKQFSNNFKVKEITQ